MPRSKPPFIAAATALRSALGLLFAVLALGAALPAAAQTITVNASGSGGVGLNDSQPIVGETAIPLAPQLLSYSLSISGSGGAVSFRPVVFEWSGSNVVGGPVYTGPVQTAPTGPFVQYVFTPNVTLDPAKQYVFAVERTVPGQTGLVESKVQNTVPGNIALLNGTWGPISAMEAHFTATFGPAPVLPPAPVPTMSEWALILLGLILAGGAVLTLQRRRAA